VACELVGGVMHEPPQGQAGKTRSEGSGSTADGGEDDSGAQAADGAGPGLGQLISGMADPFALQVHRPVTVEWWLNIATLLGWLLSSILALSLAKLSRNL
jgi:hypothetical protein